MVFTDQKRGKIWDQANLKIGIDRLKILQYDCEIKNYRGKQEIESETFLKLCDNSYTANSYGGKKVKKFLGVTGFELGELYPSRSDCKRPPDPKVIAACKYDC